MNKLRLYINLLIVIQIGFLNRRLEVMCLVSAFCPPDVLRLTCARSARLKIVFECSVTFE